MQETEAALAVRFGAAIRVERKKRRWSQAVLAERLDVSLDYVGMLERGERLPSFLIATRIAGLFSTTLSAMLAESTCVTEAPEPWLDEAVAILRSLDPQARAIALGMLRAASVSAPEVGERARKRRISRE